MQDNSIKAEIIGFDSGWGCANFGCEDGPGALQADQILYLLRKHKVEAKWRGPLGLRFIGDHDEVRSKEDSLPQLLESVRRLAEHVSHSIESGHIPVVIGGDHSSAIGTWSGAVSATDSYGRFGLVWLDAHLDAHTYETSSVGKWGGWWHGQPVTALLGHGLPSLRNIGGLMPKLAPQNLSIIGPHSFEEPEKEFVDRFGIRVFFYEEVEKRGFQACFDEAMERALDGTQAFGLSIDLDAFHPDDAPGVGTAEDRGLRADEVLPVIKSIARHASFSGLELAEFNPHNDSMNKTLQLIENIIESAFS